jgi:hypothetical protein
MSEGQKAKGIELWLGKACNSPAVLPYADTVAVALYYK